ncbi:T9SS type A sorting domain-containing protein [Flexibacter flexilis]|uniref:T9SS type A sorting domain-containing protein n=1 Tax=Flexibacter flexilis TaxID=998 RepID=UPI0015A532B9|nr:T9SS type A sorting domain-containing protein [Flexibacter flexilis]
MTLISTADQIAQQNDIQIFPNPTTSDFTLEGEAIKSWELFDTKGGLIHQNAVSQAKPEPILIQLNNMAQGVYFLKVFTLNSVVTKRLIIQ